MVHQNDERRFAASAFEKDDEDEVDDGDEGVGVDGEVREDGGDVGHESEQGVRAGKSGDWSETGGGQERPRVMRQLDLR